MSSVWWWVCGRHQTLYFLYDALWYLAELYWYSNQLWLLYHKYSGGRVKLDRLLYINTVLFNCTSALNFSFRSIFYYLIHCCSSWNMFPDWLLPGWGEYLGSEHQGAEAGYRCSETGVQAPGHRHHQPRKPYRWGQLFVVWKEKLDLVWVCFPKNRWFNYRCENKYSSVCYV